MDASAFFAAIRDEPSEPLHRLAFADWCDDGGDPARAEAVRIGVDLQRRDRWDWERPLRVARARRLARDREPDWRADDHLVEEEWFSYTYEGGLPLVAGMKNDGPVERLPLPAPVLTFIARGDGRFLAHPNMADLNELVWLSSTAAAAADNLAACGALQRLTSLAMQVPTGGWSRLFAAPLLGRLTSLSLDISAVASLPTARPARLRELSLWGDPTAGALRPLENPAWHGLTELRMNLGGGYVPPDELLASPALASLQVLDFGHTLDGLDVTQVFANPRLTRLRALRAWHREGVPQPDAVRHADLPALEHLNLSRGRLSPTFVAAVADSPFAPRLRSLVLRGCQGVTADAARALAAGDFRSLRHLDLNTTSIGHEGLAAVLDAPWMSGVRSLRVAGLGLRQAAAAALGAAARLSGLRTLDVSGNYLDDAGVAALVSSPHLAGLHWLDLRGTHPKADGIAALADAPMRHRLEVLRLGGDEWIGAADPVPLAGRLPRLNELLWDRAGPPAQLRLRSAFGPAAVTFAVPYTNGV